MIHWIKISIIAGSVTAGIFTTSCNNVQNKSSDMENHQHDKMDRIYACPMHPEVTGKQGDKCPTCGMDLEWVQTTTNNIEVKITSTPQVIEAGKPTLLSISITENGKPTQLEVAHEKKIHFIVVNEELTWFDHLHPQEQANGNYTVTETFPNGGKYISFADFKTNGGAPTLNKQELEVSGNVVKKTDTVSNKWISNIDGYTVTLVNGNDFKTNRTQHLGVSIGKNGKQLSGKDVETYLGAVAHMVMISKEDKEFKHIHPISNERFPIYGETSFEKPGIYRMWVQFQTNGQVHTADFTVDVKHGDKESGEEKPQDHHH
jgi:hypothetical protein